MTGRPGEQLRQLAAKATRGPWRVQGFDVWAGDYLVLAYTKHSTLVDTELAALAPDLAVLVADLADALERMESDGHLHYQTTGALLARVGELEAAAPAVVGERQPDAIP